VSESAAARPLVWLPFPVDRLPEAPAGLRYAEVVPDRVHGVPASAEEVEFYVLPYRFDPYDVELIAGLPKLRVVQTQTAGVDHVRKHLPEGVLLCNGRGIHDASTAELAVGLMIAAQRGFPDFVRAQDEGEWTYQFRPSLADRKVLIVGYGQIGAAIEARLAPFEVEVTRVARSARPGVHAFTDLPDLLPHAEIVVLIVPDTPQTRGLVDAKFLAALPDDALVVNVARGPVVVTDDLVAALQSGRIRAALDVTDPEPLPPDHPLWTAPGVLISPHVGGASSAMEPRSLRLVAQQLRRFAEGEPLANVMTGAY
jgi:phosphoglycerate dehydrogenase-like enzyme